MPSLPLALIYDPPQPGRALQQDAVARLAIGIERLGLRTPVSVRPASRIRDGKPADVWEIVAGRHRVAAVRKLGWSEIEAIVLDPNDVDCELWQIAENLRAELTVQERADNVARWVKLTGDKNKGATCADIPKGRGQPQGGVNAAVRDLGIDRTEAQRSVKIASITPAAKEAAREARLDDNQSALLRIAKAAPSEQVSAVRQIVEQKAVKPAPAPLNDVETEEQWMTAIMRVWNRGAPQWRERFIETVERPIFDHTRAGSAA